MGNEIETPADVLQRLGDDAAKWAAEFRATAVRLGYSDMDEGWLIGWFANAIEHSGAVRRWRKDAATLRQQAFSQFANPEALADWLDALHECHADGSVGNRKWDAAQVAARAIRSLNEPSGNSGQLRQQAGRVDEVEDLKYRLETAEAYGRQCDDDMRALLDRAEKAEAALAQNTQGEKSDDELPGMWSNSDFTGGDPDERSHAERARGPGEVDAFDKAVADELPRVSHVEFDSHEICKHFAGKVRERMLATAPSQRAEVK